jgi:hypothetical protein
MKTLNFIVLPVRHVWGIYSKNFTYTSIREHRRTSGLLFVSEKRARAPETERRNREIRRECACVCIYIYIFFSRLERAFSLILLPSLFC